MKVYGGTTGILPLIPNHSTIRTSVVNFIHWLLYLQGKITWHPLRTRLGGPQSEAGHFGEEQNLLPLLGI